eukprot:3932207-Rhodomonas_salina.2
MRGSVYLQGLSAGSSGGYAGRARRYLSALGVVEGSTGGAQLIVEEVKLRRDGDVSTAQRIEICLSHASTAHRIEICMRYVRTAQRIELYDRTAQRIERRIRHASTARAAQQPECSMCCVSTAQRVVLNASMHAVSVPDHSAQYSSKTDTLRQYRTWPRRLVGRWTST